MKASQPTNIKISKFIIIFKIVLHIVYAIYTIVLININMPEAVKDEYLAKLMGEQTGHMMFYALPLVLLWLFFFSRKYFLTLIFVVILVFSHISNHQPPILTIVLLLLLITKESRNWFNGIIEKEEIEIRNVDTEILDR